MWGPAFDPAPGQNLEGKLGTLAGIPITPFAANTRITVLGIPVCHPEGDGHAKGIWTRRLAAVQKACDVLGQLPSSHVQFTLLRLCLDACKVNDLLRACHLTAASTEVTRLTGALRDTLGGIMGSPLSDDQWRQATLPTRLGGLGLKDLSDVRLAARLATILDYLARGRNLLGLPVSAMSMPPDTALVLANVGEILGTTPPLAAWQQDPSLLFAVESGLAKQQHWQAKIFDVKQKAFALSLVGPASVRFAS